MRDDLEILGGQIVNQARLPGAGSAGLASSVGGSATAAAGIPTPTYFVGDDGLPVRFFIPGRSPLYRAGMNERYIIGEPRDHA